MNLLKQNDYELIYLIRRNNSRAFDLLLDKYTVLIVYKVRKYTNNKSMIEDLIQDCLLEVVSAVNKFDDNINILFSSYVSLIIDRKLRRTFKVYYRDINAMKNLVEQTSRVMLNEENTVYNCIVDSIANKELYDEFKITLNDLELLVFDKIMLQKTSIKKISDYYNIDNKKIYNTIQSVKVKYRRLLEKKSN